MVVNPAIVALVIAVLASSLLLAYSAGFGWHLVRHWDLSSGSELQLNLERHTYLISTLVALVLATEGASLLLFVYNADRIAPLFVGAMCAVGTLNTSAFGFPALLVKILVFFAASSWLILHHLDTRGYDYPLTRLKFLLLLAIAPLVLIEAYLQIRFFLALDTDVITSCCGSLFGTSREALGSELAGLPPALAMTLFLRRARRDPGHGAGSPPLALRRGTPTPYSRPCRLPSPWRPSSRSSRSMCTSTPTTIAPSVCSRPNTATRATCSTGRCSWRTALGIGSGVVRLFAGVPSLRDPVPPLALRLTNVSLGMFFFLVLWTCILTVQSALVLLGNEGV